jgi:Uma2 family endonuclease
MTTAEYPVAPIEAASRRMTEEEFEAWALAGDVRAEWVEGEVILISPANIDHEDVIAWLLTLMRLHAAKHNLGKVGGSNVMLRLKNRRRLPDLFFIAKGRESIIKKTHLDGPADLIVEVVSPDSQSRDRRDKFLEYEANGVREYWIIDPISRQAEFYLLQESKYVSIQTPEGILRSATLAGFWIKVEWLWQNPLPNEYETAKTLGIF